MLLYIMLSICLIVVGLGMFLLYMTQQVKDRERQVSALKSSLEEMDEQAKLIMRTDMELNKTQEELDKKITGLNILQRLSRDISTTLEEKQIFKKISNEYLEELGFEKSLAFLWNDLKREFHPCLNLGYSNDESEEIKERVNTDKDYYLDLIHSGKTASSVFIPNDFLPKDRIYQLFLVRSFIICPIFWASVYQLKTFV